MLTSRAVCLIFRQEIAQAINELMPCDNVSQNARRKLISLVRTQFFILFSSACLSCLRTGKGMADTSTNLTEISDMFDFFRRIVWEFLIVPSTQPVMYLFVACAQILVGKLDTLADEIRDKGFVAKRDPLERQYLAIWEQAKSLNSIFGLPALMFYLWLVCSSSATLYVVISTANINPFISAAVAWSLLNIGSKSVLLTSVCESAAKSVSSVFFCSIR